MYAILTLCNCLHTPSRTSRVRQGTCPDSTILVVNQTCASIVFYFFPLFCVAWYRHVHFAMRRPAANGTVTLGGVRQFARIFSQCVLVSWPISCAVQCDTWSRSRVETAGNLHALWLLSLFPISVRYIYTSLRICYDVLFLELPETEPDRLTDSKTVWLAVRSWAFNESKH